MHGFQQFEPFRAVIACLGVEAGDVAARAGEAGCEPGSDEVVADGDDGDPRRLVMGRQRRRIPRRDQDVDAGRQKLGDQRRYPLRLSFGIALIEHKIAAENVSPIDKALPQAAAGDGFVVGRPDPDEADPRNLRLLRPRGERPRGSKAHDPDERAPPHSITLSALVSNILVVGRPILQPASGSKCATGPARRNVRAERSSSPDFVLEAQPPRITRIRLSDKTSRLRPRHVVPKPAQTYEPEVGAALSSA